MDNAFYRFNYMRKNIISIPIILFVLFLTVNVIAFTWVILFISLSTFLITILLFIKFGLPLINEEIMIHVDGIEWILKGKQMALFRWVDIVDILEIRISMITTFVLLLADDMSQKSNISTFKFDANKKILNVMKVNCKNESMLSKIMNLNPRY